MDKTISLNASTANTLRLGVFTYRTGAQEGFLSVNAALSKILGCSSKHLLQKATLDSLFSNTHSRNQFLKQLQTEKKVRYFEVAHTPAKGKTVWLSVSACMAANSKAKSYIEGIVQDITALKGETEKLNEELDVLQSFLDSMPDAIYFKDSKNRLTKVNQFYAKGHNCPKEVLIGKSDYDFFPEDQAQGMFKDDNYVLKTGRPIIGKVEKTLLNNGTWNQVITTKVPMFNRAGKIVGTMGVTRDMTPHANMEEERFAMMLNALAVLGKALEMRDPYTYTHTRFVANIAQMIAKEMNFDNNRVMQIKLAAELHDLGKISIPLDILIKPGRLNDLEFQLVQKHVDHCYLFVKDIHFPFPLAEIIYQHHERLDGSGYPRKLKGKKILLEARILAVSDVLEAMTSHRPYRAALGIEEAIKELKSGSGTRYDSKVVNIALKLIKDNKGKPFWNNEA